MLEMGMISNNQLLQVVSFYLYFHLLLLVILDKNDMRSCFRQQLLGNGSTLDLGCYYYPRLAVYHYKA